MSNDTTKCSETQPRLCTCGCGQTTTIAQKTSSKYGWIKGQPHRYCQGHSPTNKPFAIRLWEKIDIRGPDDCWPWLGWKQHGYGQIKVNRRKALAHRVSYELTYGPIPDGVCVLHRCDNPPCCNPAHLFLGTQGDNNRDRDQKGRTQSGSNGYWTKLTEEQVVEIRCLHATERPSLHHLGRQFGVSPATIRDILIRRTWADIP